MKPVDQRQFIDVSASELSSVSTGHSLGFSVQQSPWPSSTEISSNVVVSPGQQAVVHSSLPAAPSVSFATGSVLPLSLLNPELLGLTSSSAGLSSSGLPVSVMLPAGFLVSTDGGNVQDPLASLTRLSAGVHNVVPATNINNNTMATEARKMPESRNGPQSTAVKAKQDSTHMYQVSTHPVAAGEVGNGLTVPVCEPGKLPGGFGNVYAPVKSEHPQQASTVRPQLPLVSGPPRSLPSYMNFPALHQLLQQGTTSGNMPTAPPPPYTAVSESMLPAGNNSLSTAAESTAAPPVGRRRWTSADGAGLNRNVCWGYPDHSSNVMVNLLRQESSGFEVGKNSPSSVDTHTANPVHGADADADAAEFSAPSGQGLHHKFRRKHRPQPLIIPSPVSNFGFQSRLRSPRIVDQSSPGLSTETLSASSAMSSSLSIATSNTVLTPYTPPPMLSPVRTGSGLFCSLVQPSPKSAPVGFRLGLLRASE